MTDGNRAGPEWWRTAVMMEIYPRSFADGNGDGEGDLVGLIERLPHLAGLGVDGLWIAPWYPSPMVDGGYDVSDLRSIHPMFGDLAAAERLVERAHALGLRVITDLVPNHTSDRHPWFEAAITAAPGAPQRARYFFRDGRGPGGDEPPNNWISAFGGPAWTRVTAPDGAPGQWYLHTFAPEQPDLDWTDPHVLADFDEILRFWFDRGVDGLRVDAAPALGKAPGLPDADYGPEPRFVVTEWTDSPHWDVDEVHDVIRRFRRVADEYAGDRILVAEAVVSSPERLAAYLRPDEMHTAFNFGYLKSEWEPGVPRSVIDRTLRELRPTGAPATWVTASHDETRVRTRFGRATTSAAHIADGQGEPVDLDLGLRRSRASMLLTLALPGGVYLYQGEELGLPNVDDLPDEALQDPIFLRSGGRVRGRDGARVPLPWTGDRAPYGFSPPGTRTWLPQPSDWAGLSAAAQEADPESMLRLVRRTLGLRRELPPDEFAWVDGMSVGVVAFDRGPRMRLVLNLSEAPVALPVDRPVLVRSDRGSGAVLPHDAAAWLGGRWEGTP